MERVEAKEQDSMPKLIHSKTSVKLKKSFNLVLHQVPKYKVFHASSLFQKVICFYFFISFKNFFDFILL